MRFSLRPSVRRRPPRPPGVPPVAPGSGRENQCQAPAQAAPARSGCGQGFQASRPPFLVNSLRERKCRPPGCAPKFASVSGRIAIRATGNVDVGVGHRRQSPAATRPISSPRFGRPGGPGPTWIRPFGPWRSCISAASPCDWSEHLRLTRKPNGFRAMRTPPRSSAARTAQATGPLRPGPAESNSPA
jgi:hypothetical protein